MIVELLRNGYEISYNCYKLFQSVNNPLIIHKPTPTLPKGGSFAFPLGKIKTKKRTPSLWEGWGWALINGLFTG